MRNSNVRTQTRFCAGLICCLIAALFLGILPLRRPISQTALASNISFPAYSTVLNTAVAVAQRTKLNFMDGGCVDNAGTASTDCSVGTGGTYATAGQGFLYPLDVGPSTDLGAVTLSTANRVYMFAINPKANYTIRHVGSIVNTLNASKSVGFGIYNFSGTLLSQGIVTGSVAANTAIDAVLSGAQSLTNGTPYYAGVATEDAATQLFGTILTGLGQAALNAGSQKLIGRCANSSTGTGGSFVLPATCGTITANDQDIRMPSLVLMP